LHWSLVGFHSRKSFIGWTTMLSDKQFYRLGQLFVTSVWELAEN